MHPILSLQGDDFITMWRQMAPSARSKLSPIESGECFDRIRTWENANPERVAKERLDRLNGHDPKHAKPLDWQALEPMQPPNRVWATEAWFGFGHVTLMVGQGGVGKTLCAQQWGSALALGRDFIDKTPRPLKVLMWACEDDHDELWRRQVAIAQWMQSPLSAFVDFKLVPRHGRDNTIMVMDFGRPGFTQVRDELKEDAEGYEVVILDNAAQVYGAGENDRSCVTRFLNGLAGALAGKAVMLLAHPSRAQGSEYSGSGAWEAVARTRLYLGRKLPDQDDGDEQETTRYLARRKANYSARDYRRFEFNNGVLVQDVTEGADGLIGSIRSKKAADTVLEGLRALNEKGIRVTDGKTSPQYLPRVLVDFKLNDGVGKIELADAMRAALIGGRIVRGVIGKYENRTPMFGLKTP